jgi:hypothetical protein
MQLVRRREEGCAGKVGWKNAVKEQFIISCYWNVRGTLIGDGEQSRSKVLCTMRNRRNMVGGELLSIKEYPVQWSNIWWMSYDSPAIPTVHSVARSARRRPKCSVGCLCGGSSGRSSPQKAVVAFYGVGLFASLGTRLVITKFIIIILLRYGCIMGIVLRTTWLLVLAFDRTLKCLSSYLPQKISPSLKQASWRQ